MPIYSLNKEKLNHMKEVPFKLEKNIQRLCEDNLSVLFGLEFVASEFTVGEFRIDSLAFDKQSKSFVIIEYKNTKNFSVVDQGYSYLSTMLSNKADFILEYNENIGNVLKRNDVDWSQSRIIFVSPSFSKYQKHSTNFKDLPIELWEIKRYSNDTISLNQISNSSSIASIETVSKRNKNIDKVNKEVKVYSEESHLENKPDEVIELYQKYRDAILNFGDDIIVKANKDYLSFRVDNNIFSDIEIQKKAVKLFINLKKDQLDDPKNICKDVSEIGHWGNGDYEIRIIDDENIEYIMSLVKQSYKKRV